MHYTPLDKPTATQLETTRQIYQLKIKILKTDFETKKGKRNKH